MLKNILNFFTLRRKIFLFLIGVLFWLDVITWQEIFAINRISYLKVDFLDVGQGDSIFIETPSHHQILIDGGPNSAILQKLAELLPVFDRSLDVVILTHPDADHLMGLLSVLEKYKVDYILWTGIERGGGNYQKWISLISEKQKEGSRVITVDSHTKIKSGKVLFNVLNPIENLQGRYLTKGYNDTSVVSHLFFGDSSFLFTADISSSLEKKLIDNNINLKSDILKVPHHGSKYSSSEEFLGATGPKIAVISVGRENPYGHPTPEVLQRLQEFDIKVLRTDKDGDIEVISDGENIKINAKSKLEISK